MWLFVGIIWVISNKCDYLWVFDNGWLIILLIVDIILIYKIYYKEKVLGYLMKNNFVKIL